MDSAVLKDGGLLTVFIYFVFVLLKVEFTVLFLGWIIYFLDGELFNTDYVINILSDMAGFKNEFVYMMFYFLMIGVCFYFEINVGLNVHSFCCRSNSFVLNDFFMFSYWDNSLTLDT